MSKKHKKSKTLSYEYETTIALLNIYFSEWSHRDQLLWSQTLKFFYAILILILLPDIADFLKITLPPIPSIIFRICGLTLSIIFLYVSLGYTKRLEAIGNTYQNLVNMLPKEYRRQPLDKLHYGFLFKPRMSYFICFTLFFILLLLSIILILI